MLLVVRIASYICTESFDNADSHVLRSVLNLFMKSHLSKWDKLVAPGCNLPHITQNTAMSSLVKEKLCSINMLYAVMFHWLLPETNSEN